jgi:Ca2+-binding RTX toxin-like protein
VVALHFATPIAYVLANGVENLELSDAATTGTGNAQGNLVIGLNNGVSFHLDGGAGNDTVVGAGSDDVLAGGAGDDFLFGQGGSDHMAGGAGNDVYALDSVGDVVTEGRNAGIDRIAVGFSFDLALNGQNVENLSLNGLGNIDGHGNAANNRIEGNVGSNLLTGEDGNDQLFGLDGNDSLEGGDGADQLLGGRGSDTLNGGAGSDTFVFQISSPSELAGLGSDIITEFKSGQDKIDVRDLFSAFGLDHRGNPITDGHLILTDDGSGSIVQFDADGAGGAAPVTVVAVFSGHVGLADILH